MYSNIHMYMMYMLFKYIYIYVVFNQWGIPLQDKNVSVPKFIKRPFTVFFFQSPVFRHQAQYITFIL